jgi:hypothetical protein
MVHMTAKAPEISGALIVPRSQGLDTEAGTASAGRLYGGVLELEAGGLKRLDVVDGAVD